MQQIKLKLMTENYYLKTVIVDSPAERRVGYVLMHREKEEDEWKELPAAGFTLVVDGSGVNVLVIPKEGQSVGAAAWCNHCGWTSAPRDNNAQVNEREDVVTVREIAKQHAKENVLANPPHSVTHQERAFDGTLNSVTFVKMISSKMDLGIVALPPKPDTKENP